jgi:hypothetical protein
VSVLEPMDNSIALTSTTSMTDGIRRLIATIAADPLVIHIDDLDYSVSLTEAVLLSPRVTMGLQMDLSIRQFHLHDNRIAASLC